MMNTVSKENTMAVEPKEPSQPESIVELLDWPVPDEMLVRPFNLETDFSITALPDICIGLEANDFSDVDSYCC